ncbi:MAG TPA: hypothetical protein VK272_05630 [Solirubrobacteraceae bacterium]|nr:hypothetical protein [Solirubrobacteraceae bacterium]
MADGRLLQTICAGAPAADSAVGSSTNARHETTEQRRTRAAISAPTAVCLRRPDQPDPNQPDKTPAPNIYPTDDRSDLPMTGAKVMHTEEEIQRAAKLAEEFDPSRVQMDDTTDLRTLAKAVDGVRTGEARVRELVARARANGRSWGEIGIALGVSRQAARERFAEKIRA